MKANAFTSSRSRPPSGSCSIAIVILAALVLGAAGCELVTPFAITPEPWLEGTWTGYIQPAGELWTWTFTQGNIVWTTPYGSLDFEIYEQNSEVSMEQLATTSTEYKIELIESGGIFVFRFLKSTDSSLHHFVTYNGATVGPSTFVRN